jgi:hypothetical protein
MSLPQASLRLGLCMVLACPLAGYAQGDNAQAAAPHVEPALQLAAAIGIVKPKPDPEPVQIPEPAPPASVTPPVIEQVEADVTELEPETDEGVSKKVSRNQILIGVGVAALLGAVAGGGGGGGSSTPSH